MDEATTARLSQSIEEWKEVYGLQRHHTFLVEAKRRRMGGHIKIDSHYLRATIKLNPELEGSELEETVSHEMAHLFLGELATWASTVLEYVPKDSRAPLNDAWHLVWERTAESLARLVRGLKTP